ncbi:MAG: peptidoglycan DD-metalloendopeptidase family protein [Chloroflexi bacterium]|nr:peptidoglycan DD-metalloendopeptidase family protein [Chloroflexota bacterium]
MPGSRSHFLGALAIALPLLVVTGTNLLLPQFPIEAPGRSEDVPLALAVVPSVDPTPLSTSFMPDLTATPSPTVETAAGPVATPTTTSIERSAIQEAAPAPTARPTALPVNDPRTIDRLRGLAIPIRGARLPTLDGHLPGAPRPYRLDVHRSIDFYDRIVGVAVDFGTEVLAAQAGIVRRADVEYREVTEAEMAELLASSRHAGSTPPDVLDRLQGRQVVIDHGDGIATRYHHLESVAAGIRPGVVVRRGQVIATVGNSGTQEAAAGRRIGPHLDFEIVVGGRYLGWGLTVPETRRWLELIFGTS